MRTALGRFTIAGMSQQRGEGRPPNRPPEITDRQREVARLVAAGYTNERIADTLGISLAGAKYHVSELLSRLGLSRRDEIGDWYRSHAVGRRLSVAGWWIGTTTVRRLSIIAAVAVVGSCS